MKSYLVIAFIVVSALGFSQEKLYTDSEISITEWIDGTLLSPNANEKPNLAIIIAGSGPTNRDGNQNFMKNNSLKKLAESLTDNGIATFRYDKRIVKQIRQNKVDNAILFDDFVSDATTVVAYFKEKNTYNKIYVIGHSQGSLIGMLAAKDQADGFISLAGAGNNIGDVLVDQITKMAPQLGEETQRVVDSLKKGKTVIDFPPALASVFNSDLQPFMMNWMTHNPTEILASLDMPILIINGTKDLQVSENEAQLLKDANPEASLKIIEKMNHVLVEIEGDELENSKSYNESARPIAAELISSISDFIKL